MARALLLLASRVWRLLPTRPSAMMYYRHFGLSGAPFQFTPSPQLLYASPVHTKGLAALERALNQGSAAITLLVGAAGSGKTTLASAMLTREWGRSRVVYLANPKVGCVAMMREILRQLGIAEHGNHQAMVEEFQRYLASFHANERILILIDEAHHLDDAFCDQIELFLRAKANGVQRLSLALIGQLELLDRVASARQQRLQEITASLVVLKPLPRDEAIRYVEYRLAAYDGSVSAVFSPGALEYLLEHAVGLPRQINVLCHNAMLMAYAARTTRVTLDTARTCVSELEGPMPKAGTVDSSPGKDSRTQSQSDKPRAASVRPPTAQKIRSATSGMGIGLLIISIVVMSVLWLFGVRSQARPRNGLADTEVPAIFNDDWNGSSETASGEVNQVTETSGNGLNIDGSTTRFDDGGNRIREGSKTLSQAHRQVTISQGSSDHGASSVHGSGFGS
jgi:type II secretory pathway predicted ATPase ExeA